MQYYIIQTIKKMEIRNPYMLEWVSLFNTTVAFSDNNIRQLFLRIFESAPNIKYSFFQYLSVLLFKESDNLLAVNETREFWTSDIWDFDDGYGSKQLFWNDNIVGFFDKEINQKRIENLFQEIRPLMCNVLEPEFIELFHEEMNQSFATGVFYDRKAEFLKKINSISKEYIYWNITF